MSDRDRFQCKSCGFVANGWDAQEKHTEETQHRRWVQIDRHAVIPQNALRGL